MCLPVQILAKAIVMPRGVLRLIALTTRSLFLPDGRLSTGKAERTPAIPAVIFWWIHQSSSTRDDGVEGFLPYA
jgi:hypothetical protein